MSCSHASVAEHYCSVCVERLKRDNAALAAEVVHARKLLQDSGDPVYGTMTVEAIHQSEAACSDYREARAVVESRGAVERAEKVQA